MAIFLPKRWQRQPSGPVQVNWNNPHAQGLLFAWSGSDPYVDAANGFSLVKRGSFQILPTSYGMAQFGPSSSTGILAHSTAKNSASDKIYDKAAPPLTVCAYMQNTSAAGNQGRGLTRPNGSGADSWYVGLWKGSGSSASGGINTTGGTLLLSNSPTDTVFDTTKQPRLVTLAVDPVNTNLWCDNIQTTTGLTPSGNFVYQWGDQDRALTVGATYRSASTQRMFIGFGAVWGIARTYNQHLDLSQNPWQLFEEPRSRQIFFTAGGGTSATVNSAGVQAIAAVGAPTATGAAKAAPTGISAATMVGTPTATGGMSVAATALPDGVSSAASVGVPTATGAAKAAPAGIGTTAGVGNPTAIGGSSIPATALPAGVAASASVGLPVAQGAALITPSGVSVAASVGTPTATGGASSIALPAGVAVASSVGAPAATGSALRAVAGVGATASVGTATAYGGTSIPATASPAGVSASSSTGSAVASGAAAAQPLGVSAFTSVGQLIATGAAWAYPSGVGAAANVGQVKVSIAGTPTQPARIQNYTASPRIRTLAGHARIRSL